MQPFAKRGSILVSVIGLVVLPLQLAGCASEPVFSITPDEATAIAKEAYVYGFPLVVNYKTMYQYSVDESSPEYKGAFNSVACEARLFTPEDKAVVTPNADTPYCMFWSDVRSEPLVLKVPEVESDRFYQVQLIDLYTHNFAYVSTLATGHEARNYLIASPGWQGEMPEGIAAVLPSETALVFSIIRTQLFGPDDLDRVAQIQDGYTVQPLSAFLGEAPPRAAPEIDFPPWNEGDQFNVRFFEVFDFVLTLVEPMPEERALFERFSKIGLGTEEPFDLDGLQPEIAEALAAGARKGFEEIESAIAQFGSDPLISSKIFGTREFLLESARVNFGHENHHLIRAAGAHAGLFGNSGSEALYPIYLVDSEGNPLDASQNAYRITFAEGELPPVRAFWSLTMYDSITQLFIENPLDRYLLNSTMLDQFEREADGRLVLHIQQQSPGTDRESNWLPAPDGPFYMVLRLYGPEELALEGHWSPPPAEPAG